MIAHIAILCALVRFSQKSTSAPTLLTAFSLALMFQAGFAVAVAPRITCWPFLIGFSCSIIAAIGAAFQRGRDPFTQSVFGVKSNNDLLPVFDSAWGCIAIAVGTAACVGIFFAAANIVRRRSLFLGLGILASLIVWIELWSYAIALREPVLW